MPLTRWTASISTADNRGDALPGIRHGWNLTPSAARTLQRNLARRVRLEPLTCEPSWIAGVDCGVEPDGRMRAVIVVMRADSLTPVQTAIARVLPPLPYIPGLLSFRELPGILAAIDQLDVLPDLFLCDGQGIAHPRRLGIASHLGLWVDRPTIGVGKSRLVGSYQQPGDEKGDRAPLMDGTERLGTVLRSRRNVRPLFVSPGHRIDQEGAVHWTLRTLGRFRLPEPIRAADRASRD